MSESFNLNSLGLKALNIKEMHVTLLLLVSSFMNIHNLY